MSIFITLEGGDGVGKSTQSRLLTEWLESQGHEVMLTREPGGTALGAEVRRLLLHGGEAVGDVDARAEALLYAADRAQNIATVVRPALERGAIVVQDRFIDSSLAYQGAGRVLDAADVRNINEWAAGGLWPHLTVLLDLEPEVAVGRVKTREQGLDRLEAETREFHESVRRAFLAMAAAEPGRFIVVDAASTPEEIHLAIRPRVEALLASTTKSGGHPEG